MPFVLNDVAQLNERLNRPLPSGTSERASPPTVFVWPAAVGAPCWRKPVVAPETASPQRVPRLVSTALLPATSCLLISRRRSPITFRMRASTILTIAFSPAFSSSSFFVMTMGATKSDHS